MTKALKGVGLGFRIAIAEEIVEQLPDEIDFLEIHPENYMRRGGRFPHLLAKARERYPVGTHGLTMNLGSPDPFDEEYLGDLRRFLDDLEVSTHSDHLCFGGAGGVFLHDLLPLPFTDEAAGLVIRRIDEASSALRRPLAIENVSYYSPQHEDGLAEAEFIADVSKRSGARILLDVNNIYVNSQNFGFDPVEFLRRIPSESVVQYHIAGHELREGGLRIDTHGEPIVPAVFELLEEALRIVGIRPILLERDNNLPPLDTLLKELRILHETVERQSSFESGAERAEDGVRRGAANR